MLYCSYYIEKARVFGDILYFLPVSWFMLEMGNYKCWAWPIISKHLATFLHSVVIFYRGACIDM